MHHAFLAPDGSLLHRPGGRPGRWFGGLVHQFHALGLVLVGLALARHTSRWLVASGALMVAGLLLFCLNINARTLWGWDAARALVPFGGSAFILAWLALALGVLWPGQRPGFTPEAPANAR